MLHFCVEEIDERSNIFYKLITNEDQCTELLCNMLQFDSVMEVFKKFLTIKSNIKIDYNRIQTRIGSENKGIPDFIYEDNSISIIIEVKKRLDTQLTAHQPKSYLKIILNSDAKNKYLIFLVPRDYKHLPEIYKRIDKFKNDSIFMTVLFWEEFIYYLVNTHNKIKTNPVIENYIEVLKDIFPIKEVDMKNIKTSNLNSKALLNQWNDISGLIDLVSIEFKNKYSSKGYNIKLDSDNLEYGFNIEKNGKLLLWFGRWTLLWEKSGYALAVYSHSTWVGCSKFSSDYYLEDYGPYYPLMNVDNKSEIINECIKLIEQYL